MMQRTESEILDDVYLRLFQALNNYPLNGLKLRAEDKWQTGVLLRTFDITVYKGSDPLMIIEVKRTLDNKNQLAIGLDQIVSSLTITNARFGVVTDSEKYYLFDRKFKDRYYILVDFETILSVIVEAFEVKLTQFDKNELSNIFVTAVNEVIPDNPQLRDLLNPLQLKQKINYDSNRNTYHFIEEGLGAEDFENKMFTILIGKFTEETICRYTSLNTAFLMVNTTSFRMSGLVGMNDKSEINYVDTYLNGIEKPLIKQDIESIESLNNKYITSCSTANKVDDLTLWRLYAEDGKGACLQFNVNYKNLNPYVLIHKVKYADPSGKHKELDFLKYVSEEVERLTGFAFEFRKLNFWKHFFKPHQYAVESEVRLLIIDNPALIKLKKDWVLTHSHSIANPIIDFRLNSSTFPIALTNIILGAKCPEQETNKVQFEELIRKKSEEVINGGLDSKLDTITVDLSNITHYR